MPPRRNTAFDYYDDWTDQIDHEELINYINREMRPLNIYISDTDIRNAVDELRDAASSENYSREDRLIKALKMKLEKDQESRGTQGLHRSRGRFLIFCYVAHLLESQELARTLLRFFNSREGTEIDDDEKSFMLTEWGLGLQKLEGLVPQEKLEKAFIRIASRGPPMFEEWRRPGQCQPWVANLFRRVQETMLQEHGRGRDQLQLITSPVRRPSLPAFRRPSMIVLPPYPRTGYNSPIVTPRHELNTLRFRQDMQALELNRLRRDVDDLRYR